MTILSLSPLTVVPASPAEQIDAAAQAGFTHVGLRLVKVLPTDADVMSDAALRGEIQRRLAATGIKVLDIEVVRVRPDTDVAALTPMLDFAGELGASLLTVTSDALAQYHAEEEPAIVAKLAEICEAADTYQIRPSLEFMAFRGIGSLAHALRILDQVDDPRLALCLDALHLFRSGGKATDLAGLDSRLLGSVQLSDTIGEAPDDLMKEARSARLYPGEGELPLRELLQVLTTDLPISLEAPSDSRAHQSASFRAEEILRHAQTLLA